MNDLAGHFTTLSAATGRARPAPMRRLSQQIVLREIAKAGGPVRAYELARRLQRRMARRISVNSVYRILAGLELKQFVHRIECLKAWVVVPSGGAGNLHLICSNCGAIRSVAAPSVSEQLGRLAAGQRFAARRLVLETIGLCGLCSSQTPQE